MVLKWLLNILKHRKSTKTKKAYIVAAIQAQLRIVYTQLNVQKAKGLDAAYYFEDVSSLQIYRAAPS